MTGSSSTCVKPMSLHVVGELRRELAVASSAVGPSGRAATSRGAPRRSRSARRARCAAPRSRIQSLVASTRSRAARRRDAGRAAAARSRTRTGRALSTGSRRRGTRCGICRRCPACASGTLAVPDARVASRCSGWRARIPAVEVADDRHRRARSAPRPRSACRPARQKWAPELLVQPRVRAFAKEVQVVAGQGDGSFDRGWRRGSCARKCHWLKAISLRGCLHLPLALVLYTSTVRTDYVQRFLFENLDIRGRLTCLTGAWQRMLDGRGYPENIAALLGHTTALNVLLGANQKGAGRVTLQVQGSGPIKPARLRLHRGAAHPRHGELPRRSSRTAPSSASCWATGGSRSRSRT